MSFLAARTSACSQCPDPIREGDQATYVDDQPAHVACPAELLPKAVCAKCFTVPSTLGTCLCEES